MADQPNHHRQGLLHSFQYYLQLLSGQFFYPTWHVFHLGEKPVVPSYPLDQSTLHHLAVLEVNLARIQTVVEKTSSLHLAAKDCLRPAVLHGQCRLLSASPSKRSVSLDLAHQVPNFCAWFRYPTTLGRHLSVQPNANC